MFFQFHDAFPMLKAYTFRNSGLPRLPLRGQCNDSYRLLGRQNDWVGKFSDIFYILKGNVELIAFILPSYLAIFNPFSMLMACRIGFIHNYILILFDLSK